MRESTNRVPIRGESMSNHTLTIVKKKVEMKEKGNLSEKKALKLKDGNRREAVITFYGRMWLNVLVCFDSILIQYSLG